AGYVASFGRSTFAVSIPTIPAPHSTRSLAPAPVSPGFSERYADVLRRRSHQPVRRRIASPCRTGFGAARRAAVRWLGRIRPCVAAGPRVGQEGLVGRHAASAPPRRTAGVAGLRGLRDATLFPPI